jgi:hypothetical protein
MLVSIVYYIIILISTIIFCVCIVLFLKKPFYNLATAATSQLDIILNTSKDEEEKDALIIKNLVNVMEYLLTTIILLIIISLISLLPLFFYFFIADVNYDHVETSSIYFYGSMIIGSFSLFLFKSKSNYSYWSRLLHSLILDNYNIGRILFQKEFQKVNKRHLLVSKEPFVIVSGLARAGTTALTNLLYDNDFFHSINYSNVPFLLAPNYWSKIYSPKKSVKKERAHGDKVLFSERSIEALEEYFFKVFLNDQYIKENFLLKHEVPQNIIDKYINYQRYFQKKPNTTYLAKNNNFLLRYESFLKNDVNFKLILICRNPIDHSRSLLNQHERFVEMQKSDGFVLKYMDWLGHHEFGLNQKYFRFKKGLDTSYTKTNLNYWLSIWINYYSYVLDIIDSSRLILVNYECFLKNPLETKMKIFKYLGKKCDQNQIPIFEPNRKPSLRENEVDNMLFVEATRIYEELILKSINNEM